MSYAATLTQSVTVQHIGGGGAVDPYGDAASTVTGSDVYAARLQSTGSTETTAGRDTIVSDWLLFLPAGAVIGPRDRVLEGTRTFEVVGSPDRVWGARAEHHVEARLRYVEGG